MEGMGFIVTNFEEEWLVRFKGIGIAAWVLDHSMQVHPPISDVVGTAHFNDTSSL